MEDDYFKSDGRKTIIFVIGLIFIGLCEFLSLNTDLLEYSQHLKVNIPGWIFGVLFPLDAAVYISLILIYFYKKIGVFLFPAAVISHYILQNFYLSTVLYSDLNVLFFFLCIGLFLVIPRWKFFR